MTEKKLAKTPYTSPAYIKLLESLKEKIRSCQVKVIIHVNSELVHLYNTIGCDINARFDKEGWGTKVIDRLSKDLKASFPDMRGVSPRNLRYMRKFAQIWSKSPILQEVLAKLTWYNNITLLEKLKSEEKRVWYAKKCLEYGWSHSVLVHQIESGLYERQRNVPTNFKRALPAPQSELAQEMVKDPYNFDFLSLGDKALERDIERSLLRHIREFLIEMGVGFAFVGNQVHIEVGDQDFYVDLLFYHLKLRCFVVIDLKAKAFEPEFAGKMNFYLSAIDDMMRHPQDNPSIGLILCKKNNRLIAEYALKDTAKPIGISTYKLMKALPKNFKGDLPTIEEIEKGLSKKK